MLPSADSSNVIVRLRATGRGAVVLDHRHHERRATIGVCASPCETTVASVVFGIAVAGRSGVERQRAERIAAALRALDQHLGARRRRQQQLVEREQLRAPVAVARELVELVAVELEPVVDIGADVGDAQELRFARRDA